MTTPRTAAGRAHVAHTVGMDVLDEVLAIEAEARAAAPIDVDRLAAIMTVRMPDGCYMMRDDGSKFDIISPATAAAMLAHLYETGDVLSGLAAIDARRERSGG